MGVGQEARSGQRAAPPQEATGRFSGGPRGRIVQAERKVPALTPATKEEKAVAGTVRTGPDCTLESRTGTMPWTEARLAATSTHWPPLLL